MNEKRAPRCERMKNVLKLLITYSVFGKDVAPALQPICGNDFTMRPTSRWWEDVFVLP